MHTRPSLLLILGLPIACAEARTPAAPTPPVSSLAPQSAAEAAPALPPAAAPVLPRAPMASSSERPQPSTKGLAHNTSVAFTTPHACVLGPTAQGDQDLTIITDLVGTESWNRDGQLVEQQRHLYTEIHCTVGRLVNQCRAHVLRLSKLERERKVDMVTLQYLTQLKVISLSPETFRAEVGPFYGGVNLVLEAPPQDLASGRVYVDGRTQSMFSGKGGSISLVGHCYPFPGSPEGAGAE